MEINGTSATGSTFDFVDPSDTGFAGLTAESFLKLLITQLQNQDPTEPVSNEDLVNQLSAMRNLQANIDLSDSLQSITSNQQLSTAASFIGKSVTGTTADNRTVTGVVDRAFVEDGNVLVGIGEDVIAVDKITGVNLTSAA